ncbi:MAG: ABC transporter ATP-binding protein [Dethiobacteria bacterium]|jgi:branched-chain amino acid transport system ATP-binding protein
MVMHDQNNNVILHIDRVSRHFGGLKAVDSVQLNIHKKEIVGLIGPNGAGKTTLFNLITGHYKPTEGSLYFQNEIISGLKPYKITGKGIARTFQNIRLFGMMSVLDNVLLGMHVRLHGGLISAILCLPGEKTEEAEAKEKARALLDFVGMGSKEKEKARNLSYGEQRLLEIARALAAEPELLLLDEPAAGMNPQETGSLMKLISRIRDEMDKTILLIEHDMKVVMGISEKVAVLDYGKKIAEGRPHEIQRNEAVIRAYLGDSDSI